MRAKSIKGKSPDEIQSALQQSIADARLSDGQGFEPTLAIVFISLSQDRDALCKILNDAGIAIYGATSNGEFIDENYEQGSISILLLDINIKYFFIQFAELNGKDDRQITADLARQALKKFRDPAFLVTSCDLQTDIEEMLAGFTDSVGSTANIAGGMAGDDLSFSQQFVFTNKESGNRAVLTLVLDQEKVIMKERASHGWRAVGTDKTITRSEANRLFTIDGVPALDVCLKYSGLPVDHPKLIHELVMNFPLQLQRENGDPLMRPAYMINWEDHSLMTSGKLPQGSKIRFSLPPDFDVIEKVIEENRKFRETEMPEADALLIYNCGGRLLSFGPLIGEEIKGIKEVWNVPMAGMFSNAEIGRTRNGNVETHNLTTCWVVLKEKK
ncbi:MAG: hypothetical protein E6H09_19910 [Bacteroidetes bacterium]|jgi:hypothetical protein|nr:MAG: hypothetical protein E6H09_19910 [Bacteroidota bacterium]